MDENSTKRSMVDLKIISKSMIVVYSEMGVSCIEAQKAFKNLGTYVSNIDYTKIEERIITEFILIKRKKKCHTKQSQTNKWCNKWDKKIKRKIK